jgi:hypothetical protein
MDTTNINQVGGMNTQGVIQNSVNQTPPSVQAVITPESLQPQAPINLPPTAPAQAPTVDQNVAFFSNLQNQRSAEEARLAQEVQAGTQDISRLISSLGGAGNEQLALEQQRVNPIADQLKTVEGTLGTQLAEYRAIQSQFDKQSADVEANAGRRGITTRMLTAQQGAIERAKLAELNAKAADINITQAEALALQGKLDLAQTQVNRAIDLKYKQIENEIEVKKFNLSLISDSLTKAEKKRAEALNFALNKEEERVRELKDIQKTILNNAMASNAPQSVLSAISNASTPEQVLQAGRGFLQNPAEKLSMEIQRAQLNKLRAEAGAIANKPAIEKAEKEAANMQRLPAIKQELNLINEILGNERGLQVTANTTRFGRFIDRNRPAITRQVDGRFVTTGGRNENLAAEAAVIGTVDTLLSTGTLNALIDAKNRGATFGALSDAELDKISASYSKLSSWAIRDKDTGKITGFKATPDLVKAELQKLGNDAQNLYKSFGGVIEAGTPLGVQKADSFVDTLLETQNNPITNAGYNL